MSEVVGTGDVFLESPCCTKKFPIDRIQKQHPWNPDEKVNCPYCESPTTISAWAWYEKVRIVAFRPMKFTEIASFTVVTKPRGEE